MTHVVRFIGDPAAYLIEDADAKKNGWVAAEASNTKHTVRIRMDKAYLIDPAPPSSPLDPNRTFHVLRDPRTNTPRSGEGRLLEAAMDVLDTYEGERTESQAFRAALAALRIEVGLAMIRNAVPAGSGEPRFAACLKRWKDTWSS